MTRAMCVTSYIPAPALLSTLKLFTANDSQGLLLCRIITFCSWKLAISISAPCIYCSRHWHLLSTCVCKINHTPVKLEISKKKRKIERKYTWEIWTITFLLMYYLMFHRNVENDLYKYICETFTYTHIKKHRHTYMYVSVR